MYNSRSYYKRTLEGDSWYIAGALALTKADVNRRSIAERRQPIKVTLAIDLVNNDHSETWDAGRVVGKNDWKQTEDDDSV